MRKSRAGFGYSAIFLLVLFFVFAAKPALAGTGDGWRGALWSGVTGWISMNCLTDNTCATNNYGVNFDSTPLVSGWAWSGNLGWVCFGGTCSGTTPEGGASYANIDSLTNDVHGWANIVGLGSRGWILLNCADMPGCGSSFKVNANLQTGVVTGFGWNGNSDGTGVGWIDFSPSNLVSKELICSDGIDNDGDGLTDCADPDCLGKVGPMTCFFSYLCGPEANFMACRDGCDNDGDGLVDCADPTSCKGDATLDCPAVETACTGGNCCHNGIDDDHNGLFDCADPACFGIDFCPAAEANIVACQPQTNCCSNNIDDDGNSLLDCADPSCSSVCTGKCSQHPLQKCILNTQCPNWTMGEVCNPAAFPWLESFLNDIYGKPGIQASQPPPSSKFNATFCLRTSSITNVSNFTSELCSPIATEAIDVPKSAGNYATANGRIDLPGILGGAYGPVTTLNGNQTDVPGSGILGGRVWVINGNLTLNSAAEFQAAAAGKGSGLIVVRGDLNVNANMTYQAGASVAKLRNLASVGWLVIKNSGGTGGNVTFAPAVTDFAGAILSEETVRTGTTGGVDVPLTIYGPVVAKAFNFERKYANVAQGSERVVFDSRAILNPPPGLADFAKSLPVIGR